MEHVDFHQFNILTEELPPNQLSEFLFKMCGHPLESFTKVQRGSRFYRYRYTLGNMINVYQEPVGDNRGSNLIEIKGLGCDTLNIDFKQLIADCYDRQYKIVNVHLYIDDTANILPMQRICTEFKKDSRNRIISRFKSEPEVRDSSSCSIYFGRPKNEQEKSLFECYLEFIGERTVSDKVSGRFRQRPYEQIIKKQQNQIDV